MKSHRNGITLRIPKNIIQELNEKAKERGVSRNHLVASIIDDWLKLGRPEGDRIKRRAWLLEEGHFGGGIFRNGPL